MEGGFLEGHSGPGRTLRVAQVRAPGRRGLGWHFPPCSQSRFQGLQLCSSRPVLVVMTTVRSGHVGGGCEQGEGRMKPGLPAALQTPCPSLYHQPH